MLLVPDNDRYRVRMVVDTLIRSDGSVSIDLGEQETAVASVQDAQGRVVTAVHREVIGGNQTQASGYLRMHDNHGNVVAEFGGTGSVYLSELAPVDLAFVSPTDLLVISSGGTALAVHHVCLQQARQRYNRSIVSSWAIVSV